MLVYPLLSRVCFDPCHMAYLPAIIRLCFKSRNLVLNMLNIHYFIEKLPNVHPLPLQIPVYVLIDCKKIGWLLLGACHG